jgi:hypothetical protein
MAGSYNSGPARRENKEWSRFVAFCDQAVDPLPAPPLPLSQHHVALYLWERCEALGNSVSWKTWQSEVVSGAADAGFARPPPEWFTALSRYAKRCANVVNPVHTETVELPHKSIILMAQHLAASGGGSLTQRATLSQTALAFGLNLRPGDLAQA